MSTLFVNILRQAFKTFDRANVASFTTNFAKLKQLTEELTFRDVHLSQELISETAFEDPHAAPCTFINIFENDIVSMSVFVMRSGYTMPLHDHPLMHGLLRGIYGKMLVRSYTQKLAPNEPVVYDRNIRELTAFSEEPRIVSNETECAVLTPRERNYHEITAVNGVAAFFDILSPPYDAYIPDIGTRRCRFYRTTPLVGNPSEATANQMRLERIPAPLSYYCDIAEAPQAVAECTFICSAEAYSVAK